MITDYVLEIEDYNGEFHRMAGSRCWFDGCRKTETEIARWPGIKNSRRVPVQVRPERIFNKLEICGTTACSVCYVDIKPEDMPKEEAFSPEPIIDYVSDIFGVRHAIGRGMKCLSHPNEDINGIIVRPPSPPDETVRRAKEIVESYSMRKPENLDGFVSGQIDFQDEYTRRLRWREKMRTNLDGKVTVALRPEEVETLQRMRGVVAHIENAAGVRFTYRNEDLQRVLRLATVGKDIIVATNGRLSDDDVEALDKVSKAANAWRD